MAKIKANKGGNMKNFLIVIGILFVTFLAITDTIEKCQDIKNISTATPSQVEMQNRMKKSSGTGVMEKHYEGLNQNINQPDKQIIKQKSMDLPNNRDGRRKEPQIPNITSP